MAEQLKKFTMRRWNKDTAVWDILHPRTSADIVEFDAGSTTLASENVEDAIQEVWTIVDGLILSWKIKGDGAAEITVQTDDLVQYLGDDLIGTTVSKSGTTNTIQISNKLSPNAVKGDIVYAPDAEQIGRLPIGTTGHTLRVSSAGLPEWTTGGTVDQPLVLKFDGGTDENTDLYTFNGSTAKTIDIIGGTDTDLVTTTGSVTINHADITRTNTNSAASPGFNQTFTAIDGITTSATGHITAVNTKTITIPTETTLSKVDTGSGTWLTGLNVDDHQITLTRSNTTTDTITVGELVVSDAGAGNGNVTIDGALRGPNQFYIDALDSNQQYGEIGGEVIIMGDLIVQGTTTTVNSENVTIKDAFIQLNFDGDVDPNFTPTVDAGIEIERYGSPNVRLLWDETEDEWAVTVHAPLSNQAGTITNFTQFELFHAGNFTIPLVDSPVGDYNGPVYGGLMVYEVTSTTSAPTTTTTTSTTSLP